MTRANNVANRFLGQDTGLVRRSHVQAIYGGNYDNDIGSKFVQPSGKARSAPEQTKHPPKTYTRKYNMKYKLLCTVALFATVGLFNAQADETALAAESEARAAATAKDSITSDLVLNKVNQAIELLKKEGASALPKFKGKDSEFIFSGTYIWIHDEDGLMVMHPIKPKMVGNSVLGFTDANGKLFFLEMINLVKKSGSGWVDYMWPKPGEKVPSHKISYVKGVTVNGKLWIVGCGVYDFSDAQISALTQK